MSASRRSDDGIATAAALADADPTGNEARFTTWDGLELLYRYWAPRRTSDRALFLFHRGHEHSGRWRKFVDSFGWNDAWLFALDARGHGRSPGERGYAEHLAHFVRDIDAFVRFACRRHELRIESAAVIGHSVGAVLAAAWVHD